MLNCGIETRSVTRISRKCWTVLVLALALPVDFFGLGIRGFEAPPEGDFALRP